MISIPIWVFVLMLIGLLPCILIIGLFVLGLINALVNRHRIDKRRKEYLECSCCPYYLEDEDEDF